MLAALDAPVVLGLETAPEDTPDLLASRRTLCALLQAPTPPDIRELAVIVSGVGLESK